MVGFTDLPSELVLHIIDLAEASFVDNETFPISDGRKATLLRFSRVSRAWRAPSQMALHRRVFLQNDADVNCFLACPIAGRYPTRYLQLTHVSPTRINLVLDQLVVRDTNRIALHGLTLIEVSEFHTWSLCHPALRDLKSLQIDGHGRGLMGRLPRDLLNLPHLHSLGFVTSIRAINPEHIRVDCGLQTEELSPVYPGPGTPSLWAELDLVAPRLLSVSFQGLSDALTKPCKRFLAKCSNLVELELDGTALIVPTLCALSPDARLRRLAVGQHNHDTQKDLDPGQAPRPFSA
ncbi:BQ5605_C096g13089 [Microbotryum silenes-dioicae]|uniref:BQ5605_C096g13089 protein n=1 Tax=Microbotryum silenes-dioicae TaxID=796604 RepID=A0A2X0LSY4_9BASI|nr:BQ5605_C096g13089 [Microbotryum silenes-dioicae]